MRNVEFLVFEQNMPEVLLSRPLPRGIGFDLDQHSSAVRDSFHDTDFSHIGFDANLSESGNEDPPSRPSKLARLLLNNDVSQAVPMSSEGEDESEKGPKLIADESDIGRDYEDEQVPSPLFYGDGVDDDPIRVDDDPVVGDDNQEETKIHLKERLKQAIENGLPSEWHGELDEFLQTYSEPRGVPILQPPFRRWFLS